MLHWVRWKGGRRAGGNLTFFFIELRRQGGGGESVDVQPEGGGGGAWAHFWLLLEAKKEANFMLLEFCCCCLLHSPRLWVPPPSLARSSLTRALLPSLLTPPLSLPSLPSLPLTESSSSFISLVIFIPFTLLLIGLLHFLVRTLAPPALHLLTRSRPPSLPPLSSLTFGTSSLLMYNRFFLDEFHNDIIEWWRSSSLPSLPNCIC